MFWFQYVATVDETPAYLGGKDNTWRRLNLDGEYNNYNRQTIIIICSSFNLLSQHYNHV